MGMEDKELIQAWADWEEKQTGKAVTGKELASRMGKTASYVSLKRSGKERLGRVSQERFAKAFGVTPAEFLAGPPLKINTAETITIKEREDDMPDVRLRGEIVGIICDLPADELRNVLIFAEALRTNVQERREKNQEIST